MRNTGKARYLSEGGLEYTISVPIKYKAEWSAFFEHVFSFVTF